MSDSYDHLFKLALIGDSGVGKSCLLKRFAHNTFTGSHVPTFGVEFGSRTLQTEGETIKLQIWDTAGQQSFRAFVKAYYRGANGFIAMYDVTDRESFKNVAKWIRDAAENAPKSAASVLLVGAKCDAPSSAIQVDPTSAGMFADALNIPFVETSAKDSTNVEEAFSMIASEILHRQCADSPQQPTLRELVQRIPSWSVNRCPGGVKLPAP